MSSPITTPTLPCPFTGDWSSVPKSATALVQQTLLFVHTYMSHHDASHDISHIHRVVTNALLIHSHEPQSSPPRDPLIILLSALLHDIGDHKYLPPNTPPSQTPVSNFLKTIPIPTHAKYSSHTENSSHAQYFALLPDKIQTIVTNTSYTKTIATPPSTLATLIKRHPELAVVQDADRLDALGFVGVARCFMFGGARGRDMRRGCVGHFVEKLERLPGMMQTGVGRERGLVLGERIRVVREGWIEEAEGGWVVGAAGVEGGGVGVDDAVKAFAERAEGERDGVLVRLERLKAISEAPAKE